MGWYNETTLTGEDYEDLFRSGFAEYTSHQMAFLCALVAAFFGAIGGSFSTAVAWALRRRWAGVVAGIVAPLALYFTQPALFHDGRDQAGFIWLAGMILGSVAAAVVSTGKRRTRRQQRA